MYRSPTVPAWHLLMTCPQRRPPTIRENKMNEALAVVDDDVNYSQQAPLHQNHCASQLLWTTINVYIRQRQHKVSTTCADTHRMSHAKTVTDDDRPLLHTATPSTWVNFTGNAKHL